MSTPLQKKYHDNLKQLATQRLPDRIIGALKPHITRKSAKDLFIDERKKQKMLDQSISAWDAHWELSREYDTMSKEEKKPYIKKMKDRNKEHKKNMEEWKKKQKTDCFRSACYCPITKEPMIDPVIAPDGHTYDRMAIVDWIRKHGRSPLTNQWLSSNYLYPNLALQEQIQSFLDSDILDQDVKRDYYNRKNKMLKPAYELYREEKVEEAAELGLPEAQGEMADRCYRGRDGVAKDLDKSVEWAKKAAAGGDEMGQFRLGCAYNLGEGGLEKDDAMALKWYEKAEEQGCTASMNNIGILYKLGGHGVEQDYSKALVYFHKAAKGHSMGYGNLSALGNLGDASLYGEGVPKDEKLARKWYKKASMRGHVASMYQLGHMMIKGEGGPKTVSKGFALWEKAAAKGSKTAQDALNDISDYYV